MKEPAPTNPAEEIEKGRVALWLDVKDLEWLSKTCRCSEDAQDVEKDQCDRIRFRASAALHKASLRG